jgi:D-xylose transport system ATP-binding protein
MDEPTAALGVHETAMVADLIRELKAQGIGIFLVSHDTREMMGLCDRVSVMKNGRLIGTERVSDLTEDDILTMIILGRNPRSDAWGGQG